VAVSHYRERRHKADGVENGGGPRGQNGMEKRHEQRVERVLAGPAEAEAREGDADLRDGEQFLRLSEKRESDFGARVSFFGEMAEAGIAHRKQCDLRRGEEGVDREDQAEQQQARDVVGRGSHSVNKCRPAVQRGSGIFTSSTRIPS
jgi:hypothetical protein